MTTEDRLKAEIELLQSLLKCQADIIKKKNEEIESIKTMVIDALGAV